jgi:hypothetical protein
MVGFLGKQRGQLPGWEVRMRETPLNFAALILTGVDNRRVEEASSLLLTAVARVENTGMQWNTDRTSVGKNWGEGPTLVEGVPATITIHTSARSANVFALDGTGKRKSKVESKLSGRRLTFDIGAEHKTLWYEVETNQ